MADRVVNGSSPVTLTLNTNTGYAGGPNITTGDGAPSATPSKVGDIYIDELNDEGYVAVGPTSSDWKQATGAGGGGGLSNIVEDLTPQLGGNLDLNGNVITGLVIGTNVQAYAAALDAVSGTNTGDEAAASTTVAGVVELLTTAELDTGTDTTRAATAAAIEASARSVKLDGISGTNTGDEPAASTTVAGVVELLTTAELDTGTDTTRAATAAAIEASARSVKLDGIETAATADQSAAEIKTAYESNADTNAVTDAEKTVLGNTSGTNTGDEAAASTTTAGVVELLTTAELDTGTDTTRAATAAAIEASARSVKLDGIEALADVTDTANVTAAGALMDSEVDADLKTLALPANTTISAFGATVIDDANAATARTTLGVDAAGTDNAPAASTTVAGKSELATDAETETGTDTARVPPVSAVAATYPKKSILTTKGDILAATAASTPARLAVGTNTHVLTADSAEATGMKWAAAAAGGGSGAYGFAGIPASTMGLPGWWFNDQESTFTPGVDRWYVTPISTAVDITLTDAGVEVTTLAASGVARLAVWNEGDIVNGGGSLVSDMGTISTTTTGVKTVTGLSVALAAGNYLLGINFGTAAPTVRTLTLGAIIGGFPKADNIFNTSVYEYSTALSYGAAPDPIAAITPTTGNIDPRVFVLMKWTVD